MSNKKIAILLPFKDHFTNSKAGSASIWIKDFNKKSNYFIAFLFTNQKELLYYLYIRNFWRID